MSEVSICNTALGWVGGNPITSLDDHTRIAQLCKENFPTLRRAVLEEAAWTFATVRFTVSTPVVDPGDGSFWNEDFNRFLIPDVQNIVRIWQVYDSAQEDGRFQSPDWKREGDYILARNDIIYVKAVRDVVETASFSPMFREALAARLAADLAIPVAQSRNLQSDMWKLYSAKVTAATMSDGSQGANEKIQSGSLTRVRGK